MSLHEFSPLRWARCTGAQDHPAPEHGISVDELLTRRQVSLRLTTPQADFLGAVLGYVGAPAEAVDARDQHPTPLASRLQNARLIAGHSGKEYGVVCLVSSDVAALLGGLTSQHAVETALSRQDPRVPYDVALHENLTTVLTAAHAVLNTVITPPTAE